MEKNKNEQKEQKYRVGAYVNRDTWEKMVEIQMIEKNKTGRKPSQGQILDLIISQYKHD